MAMSDSKINIEAIQFPTQGWQLGLNNPGMKQWISPDQTMAISINFFKTQPDIPSLDNIEKIRDYYREQLKASIGGLIEVEKISINGLDLVRNIFKIQQEPAGMTYLASLTVPFQDFCYVIKVQAPELGTTGIRDTAIINRLMQRGEVKLGENGYKNWYADPYKKELNEGVLMNKAESRIYDAEFPEHPLTKARILLTKIENNITFDEALLQIEKFK